MTFERLAQIEPKLRQLEADALAAHKPSGPVDCHAWSALKGELSGLVGWWCGSADMRLVAGWNVCYRHLLACWETGQRPGLRRTTTGGCLP
jgi:hypothetical protein